MKDKSFSKAYESRDGMLRYVHAVTEAAKPDESFEAHTHDGEIEIYRFRQGKLFFSFEGRRIPISDGTLLVIADGTLHRPILTADCRYERERLLIRREAILINGEAGAAFYRTLKESGILYLTPDEATEHGIASTFLRIASAMEGAEPQGDFCARMQVLALLATVYEVGAKGAARESAYPEGTLGEILRYADTHLDADLSYGAVAGHFFLSKKTLYKLFRREVGFTLTEYVRGRRVLRAKELLRQGRAATEVALAVGFSEYTVFYRAFLAETGLSPSQYATERRG